jgi:hypothetical protein
MIFGGHNVILATGDDAFGGYRSSNHPKLQAAGRMRNWVLRCPFVIK